MVLALGVAARAVEDAAARRLTGLNVKLDLIGPMIAMKAHPGLKQIDYANMLQMDVTTFGRYAEQMDRLGYLHRERSKEDRRAMMLRLTPKGAALVSKAQERLEGMEQEMGVRFGPPDMSRFRDILFNLVNGMLARR